MNQRSRSKLLHIASSHLIGLTNQETQLALAYKNINILDLTVISGEREQVAGCFETLNSANIQTIQIKGFDEHNDMARLIREFTYIVEKKKPDAVSVNTNWQLLIAGLARFKSNHTYRIIYTIHGFRNNHPLKSAIARYLIGALLLIFADAINAPSDYVRRKFSFLSYKIKSIPLGEDDCFFKRSKLPDFTKPLKFCFPGEFRLGKNQHMLIEAFSEYLKITRDKEASLILPGQGALLKEAKNLAIHFGIFDRVYFPGKLDRQQIIDVYLDCQVAIIPSNSETFGHCIAEPLVMKRIVISRPVGIAQDYLKHGINGFIFENKNELIECMIQIRHMNIRLLNRLAENAGVTGIAFNWKNIAQKNIDELIEPV